MSAALPAVTNNADPPCGRVSHETLPSCYTPRTGTTWSSQNQHYSFVGVQREVLGVMSGHTQDFLWSLHLRTIPGGAQGSTCQGPLTSSLELFLHRTLLCHVASGPAVWPWAHYLSLVWPDAVKNRPATHLKPKGPWVGLTEGTPKCANCRLLSPDI